MNKINKIFYIVCVTASIIFFAFCILTMCKTGNVEIVNSDDAILLSLAVGLFGSGFVLKANAELTKLKEEISGLKNKLRG